MACPIDELAVFRGCTVVFGTTFFREAVLEELGRFPGSHHRSERITSHMKQEAAPNPHDGYTKLHWNLNVKRKPSKQELRQ